MTLPLTISLLLLALVLVDALGDALRAKNRQKLHHSAESLQIAGWFAFAALFAYQITQGHIPDSLGMIIWELSRYAVIYVAGRLVAFDLMFNIITKPKDGLLYMGKNDLFGAAVRWFASKVKQPYVFFSFIFKFMALLAWLGLVIF